MTDPERDLTQPARSPARLAEFLRKVNCRVQILPDGRKAVWQALPQSVNPGDPELLKGYYEAVMPSPRELDDDRAMFAHEVRAIRAGQLAYQRALDSDG